MDNRWHPTPKYQLEFDTKDINLPSLPPFSSKILLFVVVSLAFAANSGCAFNLPFNPMPVDGQCARSPEIIDPVREWAFRTDLEDEGIAGRWFDISYDDVDWAKSSPGVAWEDQGWPDYDGVGWYRATYRPPMEWGTAYLGIGGVDDHGSLWVNGTPVDWDPDRGNGAQVIPLSAGQDLQLTLRVLDLGGPWWREAAGSNGANTIGRPTTRSICPLVGGNTPHLADAGLVQERLLCLDIYGVTWQ
jgi:hypothetical protein